MPPTVTMLTRLQTAELSLVKRGANKKRYAFTKSEIPMSFKAVINTPAEGEEKLVAQLRKSGADDEAIEAAVATYRIQKGYAEILDADTTALVLKAAGLDLVAKGDKEDEEEEEDEGLPAFLRGKKKSKKEKTKKSELDLSQLDEATRSQVEAVFKSNEELVQKSEKLEGIVKALVDQQATASFVTKAKEKFAHVPGKSAEEIGLVLKTAHGVSKEYGEQIEAMLGQVSEIVAKSGLLSTSGSPMPARTGSAMTKIEALAAQVVQKSDKPMSKDAAIAFVITKTEEGRALYKQYLDENPAQRAKHGF